MPKYVIERTLPGAGKLTGDELRAISQKSNEVLDGMAGRAQWLESFVTGDKLYCVYIADDEGAVLEHAECGGFPADSINAVRTMIDPTTAEVVPQLALDRAQRRRGDLRRDLAGVGERLVHRAHAVDEAERQRLLGEHDP